jgi:hypothetical protein
MTPPVTQAARDAAADFSAAHYDYSSHWISEIRDGLRDRNSIVLAFAKAIAEETYRCAKLADDAQIPARRKALGNPDCAWNDACRDIATAIRASGGEGQSC